MVLDRLKQIARHITGSSPRPHPFDPLSPTEIEETVSLIRAEHDSLFYNAVTLQEPRKAEVVPWLEDPDGAPRPHRVADIVAVGKGSKVYDGLVDLDEKRIVKWETLQGVQPLVRRGAIRRKRRNSHLIDHYGRPPSRRTHSPKGSKGNRAMRDHWYTTRRYAQSVLRS